jgi:trigger factor
VNISVDDLGPCKKLLRFEVDENEVRQQADTVIRSITGQVQLPGFRKGKAPRAMILRSYGDEIRDRVKQRLMEKGLKKGIDDNNFRFVSTVDVEEISFDLDGPFKFAINIEVEPQFDLPNYKGIQAEVTKVQVLDDDVESALQTLAEQRAEYIDMEGAAEDDCFAIISYSGSIDGVAVIETFPESKSFAEGKNQWYPVGDSPEEYMPGFAAALKGQAVGATLTVDSVFPEDHFNKDLAGKTVRYEITVSGLKKRKLPEINDEFAATFGAENLEVLRKGVREDLENESDSRYRQDLRVILANKLSEGLDFEVPDSMVEEQTRRIVYDIVYRNQQSGASKEQIAQHKDEIYKMANESAIHRVRNNIILKAIAKAENLEVNQHEVSLYVARMAASQQTKPEKLFKELQERNAIGDVVSDILVSKAMDLIQMNANITEIPKTRQELDAQAAAEDGNQDNQS